MQILLTVPLPDGATLTGSGSSVTYRPGLAGSDTFAAQLAALGPDAVVSDAVPAPAVLRAWRAARPGSSLVLVETGADRALTVPASGVGTVLAYGASAYGAGAYGAGADGAGAVPAELGIRHRRASGPLDGLRAAERAWSATVAATPLGGVGRSVTLVGAGVVNLVTAVRLQRAGYQVTVYDQAPDPRADAHWSEYGCTRGGGDGRMFTLTEADSYNSRSWGADGESNHLLDRPVTDDGWLVAKPGTELPAERAWAADFHRLPPWLALGYNDEIFEVNRAAAARWEAWIGSEPALFGAASGYRDGILRLYTEPDYFRWHRDRNDRLGATRRVLTPQRVAADYPALADACARGTVAGGLEVVGFTVNVHRFVAALVTLLTEGGARFHWGRAVTGIGRDAQGRPDRLDTATGPVEAANVVVSPGAYGGELLRGTASHRSIQGMLGVWLTVPNVEPRLEHSLKIARKGHRAEETNATLGADERGQPTLICGSGYGWTGLDPGNIDSAQLDALFDSLADTLRRFFPAAYAAARAAGTLETSRQYCVRPWTASCLGVFESLRTAAGGLLVVTGGHNTGGFAQAPVVADAVLAAIEGRGHALHTSHHPGRLAAFYNASR